MQLLLIVVYVLIHGLVALSKCLLSVIYSDTLINLALVIVSHIVLTVTFNNIPDLEKEGHARLHGYCSLTRVLSYSRVYGIRYNSLVKFSRECKHVPIQLNLGYASLNT